MIRTHSLPHSRRAARALAAAAALAVVLGVAPAYAQAPADSTAAAPAAPADSVAPAPSVAPPAAAVAPAPAAATPPDPRLAGTHKVRLTGSERNVVRTGPGDDYAIAGVYPKGRVLDVIAKSGPWINVRLTPTESGWVHSSLCKEFDDLSGLEFRPNPKLYDRTGTFTLTGYTGAYAFDRKSNSLVLGGRFGYYVFDRVVAEGGVSWTHVRRNPEIVESLFALSLEAEDFHMLFYHLLLTYELLPGRQMVPFVSAGAGSSIMQGETSPSFNFGAGTTLFVSKRSAVRWEVRDYRMETGAKGARVTNHNVEFSLGTEFLF